MKKILIGLITAALLLPAFVQAQQKAMVEQIAALQVYLGWLEKGNNILKNGTDVIGAIKKGDLNLHLSHFDSLKAVSPGIRKSDKVQAILHMHEVMSEARPLMLGKAAESRQLSSAELTELRERCSDLAEESAKDIDELTLVTTPGKVSMSDDERIRIIARLYTGMQQKYTVQKNLNQYVIMLAEQRQRATKDAEVLRTVIGK